MAKRGRLTSSIVRCKDGIIVPLVGQSGQELVTSAGGVYETDCISESGETCVVQCLHEARDVGGVLLGIGQRSGEGQDDSREDENHVLGGGGGGETRRSVMACIIVAGRRSDDAKRSSISSAQASK